MNINRIIMDGIKEQREEIEKQQTAVTKRIAWIEQLNFWKKLLSPYLNYLKNKNAALEKLHFRYSFSENIGEKNPSLARKIFFGNFFQD